MSRIDAAVAALLAGAPLERERRRVALLAAEALSPESIWWLSFCDTDKPAGSQFLGVVIVRAPGFVSAIDKARRLGVNPGGQCQGYETDMKGLTEAHFDRLLSKAELDAIDEASVS